MSDQCRIIVASAGGNRLSLFMELARSRALAILLCEDELSDSVFAECMSTHLLPTGSRKIGEVFSSVKVCTFGMDPFPENSTIELDFEVNHASATHTSVDQLASIGVRILKPVRS